MQIIFFVQGEQNMTREQTRSAEVWPRRLPASIEPPVVSLWDNLSVSARRYPKKTALAFFDCRISYEELAGAAERLAAQLAVFGVRRGDRVLVVMQNCPQLVIAHYAIFRANAVVVPVNPMNRAEELRHYITDAQATIAVTTGDLAAELAAASNGIEGAANLRHLIVTQFADVIDLSWNAGVVPPHWFGWLSERHPLPSLVGAQVHRWQDLLEGNDELPALVTDRDDLALLPYTSGTTGLPKGCMLSHASVMHNAMTMSFWLDGTPEMVSLAVLPLFHITGLVCVMHASIFAGGTLVIIASVGPGLGWAACFKTWGDPLDMYSHDDH